MSSKHFVSSKHSNELWNITEAILEEDFEDEGTHTSLTAQLEYLVAHAPVPYSYKTPEEAASWAVLYARKASELINQEVERRNDA